MGKTYLDTRDGLKEIVEIKDQSGKSIYVEANIIETKTKIDNKIDLSENFKLFDQIYENFNIKSPLENESIVKIYSGKNKFGFFLNFCDYLIKKIDETDSIKKVNKIPMIISNLSSYKGRHTNKKTIIEKRSAVMTSYNAKFRKTRKF